MGAARRHPVDWVGETILEFMESPWVGETILVLIAIDLVCFLVASVLSTDLVKVSMLLHIISMGGAFFQHPWLVCDLFVVVISFFVESERGPMTQGGEVGRGAAVVEVVFIRFRQGAFHA